MSATPPPPSNENFSRDKITFNALRQLREHFAEPLNESEFIETMRSILPKLPQRKLAHLFAKIDVNSDGTVDWDEFTNFMFLEDQQDDSGAQGDGAKDGYAPVPAHSDAEAEGHSVVGIVVLPTEDKVLSASYDGVVSVWDAERYNCIGRMITLEDPRAIGGRACGIDALTSVQWMAHSRLLAVASIKNSVTFWDIESMKVAGKIPSMDLRHTAPLCCAYNYDAASHREQLAIGSDEGSIVMYSFKEGWHICDGTLECHTEMRTRQQRGGEQTRYGFSRAHRGHAIQPHRFGFTPSRVLNPALRHADHVTDVKIVGDMGWLVSTSLDTTINIIDIEKHALRKHFLGHSRPVRSVVWCGEYKLFASGGSEHNILLWSSYQEEVCGRLIGHETSVRKIEATCDPYRVVSVSCDNVVKMWDVRNLRCIHTIDTADEAAAALKTADICAIAEDGPRKRIILGSTSLQAWSLRSVINATKEVSHTAPVVSCVFNPGFDQVVSTDTNGGVRIWSIDTGELVTRWSTHGELKEGVEPLPSQQMTALCFDDGGRRMITGSHGGMRVQARRVLKP